MRCPGRRAHGDASASDEPETRFQDNRLAAVQSAGRAAWPRRTPDGRCETAPESPAHAPTARCSRRAQGRCPLLSRHDFGLRSVPRPPRRRERSCRATAAPHLGLARSSARRRTPQPPEPVPTRLGHRKLNLLRNQETVCRAGPFGADLIDSPTVQDVGGLLHSQIHHEDFAFHLSSATRNGNERRGATTAAAASRELNMEGRHYIVNDPGAAFLDLASGVGDQRAVGKYSN